MSAEYLILSTVNNVLHATRLSRVLMCHSSNIIKLLSKQLHGIVEYLFLFPLVKKL